jgi:TusA-related sulfurtransferase
MEIFSMKSNIILAVSLTAFVVSGCATVSGMTSAEKQQTKTLVLAKCPVLKQYSKETLMKAAQELKALPDGSQLTVLITDYSKMRDACRAITKELKKK